MKRLQYLHLYGPEVFEESLIDPLKTMKRDIMPRFLRSSFYTELLLVQELLQKQPIASELELPIPPTSLTFERSELIGPHGEHRTFQLNEIVSNRFLYLKFLSYLQECYCSENLICYRLITLFEEKYPLANANSSGSRSSDNENKHALSKIAWDIYRYFVAEDSPYEVSLEYSSRKAIRLQLAKPSLTCFEKVKKSVYNMLKTYFTSYKNKPEYGHLAEYLLTKQHVGGSSSTSSLFRNCFPVTATT
jgi:hypothetical protein